MPRTRRMLAAAVSSPSPAASPVAPAQPSTPAACACAAPAPGGAPTPAGYVARRAAGADDSFLSRKLREISNLNAVASKPLDACWAEGKKIPRLEREKLELKQKREYAEEAAAIALAEASWVDAIAEACGGRLPIATAQLAIDACDEARRAHEELREPWAAPQLPAACFNDRKVAAFGGGLGDILSKKLSKLELEQAAAREQEEQERRAPTKPARLSSGFGCTALEANLTKQYSRVEMEKQELANAQEEQDRRAPAPKARLSAGFGGASLDEAFGGKRLSKLEREQQQAREVAEARVGPASRRARATADDFGGGLGEICKPKLSRLEQEKLAWQKRAERK